MKMIGLSLAAILAWTSGASAYAQQETQAAAAAPIGSVIVKGQRARVTPEQFKDYEYEYGLSNGEAVRFSRRVGRYYVAIKGRPALEIFSTSPTQFVTSGGARLVFTEDGDKLTIDRYEAIERAYGLPK